MKREETSLARLYQALKIKETHSYLAKGLNKKRQLQKRGQSEESQHSLILFRQMLMGEDLIRRSKNSLEAISEQLKEYRKINTNLRRKIKEKDNRIQYINHKYRKLYSVIERSNRDEAFTPQLVNNQKPYLRKGENYLHLSEHVPKQKQMASSYDYEKRNIFKQQSQSVVYPQQRGEVKLPTLDNRIKNIFQKQDQAFQNPERKARVVKIPIDRLKPLNLQQVKKRFLLKMRSSFRE